jgi:hypothetical protein
LQAWRPEHREHDDKNDMRTEDLMLIRTRLAAGMAAAAAAATALTGAATPAQAATPGSGRTSVVACCMQRQLEARLRGSSA